MTERTASTPLRILQGAAVATVVVLALQFVTAGRLFGPDGPEELHAAGAIALHVVSAATVAAAFWHRRVSGGPAWPVVLAGAVFVAGFVQAALGDRDTLWAHIPGALVLTVGAVWLLAWSVRPGTTR